MSLWREIGELLARRWLNRRSEPADPGPSRIYVMPSRQAGVYVDEDVALTYSAYWRGVNYIASQVAGLPRDVIRETEERTLKLPAHPAARLLRIAPNEEMGPFVWGETMVAWACTWGNGYSEIERDVVGRPIGLWPIPPHRVTPGRNPETRKIVYSVSNPYGETTTIPARDMFHLRGLGWDGLVGYSVVQMAKRSLGLAIATEKFGADFFANGAVSAGAWVLPDGKELSKEAKERLELDLNKNVAFGEKWRDPLLEDGLTWINRMIPAKDAQMIETRQIGVADVARWLGIPVHKLHELSRATFSNIESQNIEVVNDALMPWIHRMEQEANAKLFTGREHGVRTKFNVRGLLRGDDKSRAEYYTSMRSIGAYSVNDILRLEDMDPIGPEGDIRIVQAGQQSLKSLLDDGKREEPDGDGWLPVVEDAWGRVLRREMHRVEQNRHKFTENGGFSAWFDEFAPQHREYVDEAMKPVARGLAATFGAAGVEAAFRAAVEAHIEESRRTLPDLDEAGVTARAARQARDLVERALAGAHLCRTN
jgi:HK97 family phage portal protein